MKHACPNLKLLSFHIPKTGGTSFRNTLKGVYGKEAVVRVDAAKSETVRVEQTPIAPGTPILQPVIHGHIFWSKWLSDFEAGPEVTKVIWLRDPVERVASQYYYLAEVLERELDEQGKGLNILSKLMKTFPEFIRNRKVQNILSRYVSIDDLDQNFHFVGLLEHRQEDLARLARRLDWPEYKDHQHNATTDRPAPTPEERDLIRAYNQADVRLYEQALEWREKGRYA